MNGEMQRIIRVPSTFASEFKYIGLPVFILSLALYTRVKINTGKPNVVWHYIPYFLF